MPIPGQDFTIRNDGIGPISPANKTPVVLGISSLGVVNQLVSVTKPALVKGTAGFGPGAELLAEILSLAGGPALYMRVATDVLGTIGSVTKLPGGAGTGTLAVTVAPQSATKAWQVDADGGGGSESFVDETADFADADANDVTAFPSAEAIGDYFAIGYTSPFKNLTINTGTVGVGGVVAWEFWNGTAWTAVSGLSDGTTNFTISGAQVVSFTMPTTWVARSLSGSQVLYYLRARVTTTYGTNPLLTQGFINEQGPLDRYDALVEIPTSGTTGTAVFKYSLDGGRTYSSDITVPSGGTYDPENTNIRFTFTPGGGPAFFVEGDVFSFATVAPYYSTTALGAAWTALLANVTPWRFVALAGMPASASAAATMLAFFETKLLEAENAFRFRRGKMSVSDDTTANIITSVVPVVGEHVDPVYHRERQILANPTVGYGEAEVPAVNAVAVRAAQAAFSSDLARVADGPLDAVTAIGHDEFVTEILDQHKITTLRTMLGLPGFYITNAHLKSTPASDFQYWQHGILIDILCETIFEKQQTFLNDFVRTLTAGTIHPLDASRYESIVNAAISTRLLEPKNAKGEQGHVSAARYEVDRTNIIQTSGVLNSTGFMRPFGYIKQISTDVGFALDVGETA